MAFGTAAAAVGVTEPPAPNAALLRVQDLSVVFTNRRGAVLTLDRVSFSVEENEILGLVGESGSGKTLTSLTIMGFLPPAARVTGGHLWFQDQDLLTLDTEARQAIRGRQIAMIFQNPRGALNPLMRVEDQLARVFQLHQGLGGRHTHESVMQILKQVGISDATRVARAYPHQLSGGMAQRVLVAMMIGCHPRLLIADEPTTGLDVTIQAQIFELLKEIQSVTRASILLITHDLGVVAETCRRMVVMYAGQIMEIADSRSIFALPQHPYTQRLLHSLMRVDRVIQPPALGAPMAEVAVYARQGCRFANLCPDVRLICRQQPLPTFEREPGHLVMCHKYGTEYDTSPAS